MSTLELILEGVEEEREDRWVVFSHSFGFFVYGETLEEAQEAMLESVTALINSFGEDDEHLRRFLDKKKVKYQLYSSAEQQPKAFACRLEVAVGTAA